MELKEYLNIIKKYKNLFWGVVIVVVALSLGYFYFQPVAYDTSLTLNITRLGTQNTQDYRYDDFYRLQADEKFADTIVEWLSSPRIVADIFSGAGDTGAQNMSLAKLSQSLSAQKNSSQVVAVNFAAPSVQSAQNIAGSLTKVITQNTLELNKDQQEANWFEVLAEKPVIVKHVFNYKIIFLAALLAGLFLGFWAVLIKHYLE